MAGLVPETLINVDLTIQNNLFLKGPIGYRALSGRPIVGYPRVSGTHLGEMHFDREIKQISSLLLRSLTRVKQISSLLL